MSAFKKLVVCSLFVVPSCSVFLLSGVPCSVLVVFVEFVMFIVFLVFVVFIVVVVVVVVVGGWWWLVICLQMSTIKHNHVLQMQQKRKT